MQERARKKPEKLRHNFINEYQITYEFCKAF